MSGKVKREESLGPLALYSVCISEYSNDDRTGITNNTCSLSLFIYLANP